LKPDIDDLRESQALEVAKALESGYPGAVPIVERNISELTASLSRPNITLKQGDTIADANFLLVDHKPLKGAPKPVGRIVIARGV